MSRAPFSLFGRLGNPNAAGSNLGRVKPMTLKLILLGLDSNPATFGFPDLTGLTPTADPHSINTSPQHSVILISIPFAAFSSG